MVECIILRRDTVEHLGDGGHAFLYWYNALAAKGCQGRIQWLKVAVAKAPKSSIFEAQPSPWGDSSRIVRCVLEVTPNEVDGIKGLVEIELGHVGREVDGYVSAKFEGDTFLSTPSESFVDAVVTQHES